MAAKRKLRYGMVGGGQNAFIGAVHRMAANLDGKSNSSPALFPPMPKTRRPPASSFS